MNVITKYIIAASVKDLYSG